MQNIRQPKPEAQMPEGIARADIAAPTPINGAQAPVDFAGVDVGAAPWDPTPKSNALETGEKIAAGVRGGAAAVVNPVADTARRIGRNVQGGINAVKDLYAGVTGQKSGADRQPWYWTRSGPAIAPVKPAVPSATDQPFQFNDPEAPAYAKAKARQSANGGDTRLALAPGPGARTPQPMLPQINPSEESEPFAISQKRKRRDGSDFTL